MDIFETESEIIVRLEVAGMTQDQFSISCDNSKMEICGSRDDSANKRSFFHMEIPYGHFCVEIELPDFVDLNGMTVGYLNGFLTISLPKNGAGIRKRSVGE